MLRLNLLRDLSPESGAVAPAPPSSAPRRPVLLILLVLLGIGALSAYFAKPEWANLMKIPRDESPVRAGAPTRMEQLEAEASRLVFMRQSEAIEWLHEMETVLLSDSAGRGISLAAFTPPGEFTLRGTARSGEALSGLQEALVLIPGMDLRQSRARETDGSPGAFGFLFAGSLAFAENDSVPPGNRILPIDGLNAELDVFLRSAAAAGLAFSRPDPGGPVANGLRLYSWRLRAPCDSAGFGALRPLLEEERHRNSPLGIRRIAWENRDGRKTVLLDVMAFAP